MYLIHLFYWAHCQVCFHLHTSSSMVCRPCVLEADSDTHTHRKRKKHTHKYFGSLGWQSLKTPSLRQSFITMFDDSAFLQRTLRGRFRDLKTGWWESRRKLPSGSNNTLLSLPGKRLALLRQWLWRVIGFVGHRREEKVEVEWHTSNL